LQHENIRLHSWGAIKQINGQNGRTKSSGFFSIGFWFADSLKHIHEPLI